MQEDEADLIPLDSRWEQPRYLTFRPGDGRVPDVNPPRMSWPYLPHVSSYDSGSQVPPAGFTLQLDRAGDFRDPEVEIETPYNFYNALEPLEPGLWYWRVGYEREDVGGQWSVARTFLIETQTPSWDRSVILEAERLLSERRRPRLGPSDGDWYSWRDGLARRPELARQVESLIERAEQTLDAPWWDDFPASDRQGKNPYSVGQWGQQIGPGLVDAAYAYRLTGDDRFASVKEHFMQIASYPVGGFTSPEYFYDGPKWGTRVTVHLALFYDSWHDLLSEEEREALREAIDWRLHGIMRERRSFMGAEGAWRAGVAISAGSHPFENFLHATQAILLTAGDGVPTAGAMIEPALHYLVGVATPYGPDEGWNEGMAYGVYKTSHPLEAMMMASAMLPELHVERDPLLRSLGRWHAHLLPIGIGPLPFGDSSALDPDRFRSGHLSIFARLARLTGEPRFEHRRLALEEAIGREAGGGEVLDLLLAASFERPEPAAEEPTAVHFPEAGWVMAASHAPSDTEGFQEGTGMLFQVRPRGGYGHSYHAENTFVWHGLGHTLSTTGGSVMFRSPYARHTMSHNGILVNGHGQAWAQSSNDPGYPYAGRLLAFREDDGLVHWVGDATYAYQRVEGLARAHRHVLLIDDSFFVVFDDLAMRSDADPARFSWLFHVRQQTAEGVLDTETARFRFRMEGGSIEEAQTPRGAIEHFPTLFERPDVHAEVALAGPPEALEMLDLPGREGFKNPITGEDLHDRTRETQSRWNRQPRPMAHNIWATNLEPAHEWQFLSTYTAWRSDESRIEVSFPSPDQVVATYADGRQRSVSFDPQQAGDIMIDLEHYRTHALNTDPNRLPALGVRERLEVGGDRYQIEWLHDEPFDTAWMLRWIHEGDALVKVIDGKLHQRKAEQEHSVQSTVWFRPELPQNMALRIRARVDAPIEENAGNVNLILHARENDGSAVRFGRSGQYSEYHEIPNYIITLVGGDMDQGHNRLRRNPGFNLLVDNADVRSRTGETYELLVTIRDGRIRYYIDGEKKIDYTDQDPLPAGRLGLRTWNSNIVWENIEIGRIE